MFKTRQQRWAIFAVCLLGGLLLLGYGYRARGLGWGSARNSSVQSTSRKTAEANEKTPAQESELALPEEERTYLWQIEHFVLVLDFRFWPALAGAVRDQDRDRVRSFFNSAAQLLLPDKQGAEAESLGFASFRTLSTANAAGHSATIDELIDDLFANLDEFESERKVSIKTVFLSPQDRERLDGSWQGRLLIRVWGQLKTGEPSEVVTEADFQLATLADDVPDPAPWLTSFKIAFESFRQANQSLLPEVGKSWGFDRTLFLDNWEHPDTLPLVVNGGVFVTDYDLDGRMDVFVSDIQRSVLYHQVAPGRFEDATISAGLADIPYNLPTFADLDNDGYPDLIVGTRLYQNTGRSRFQAVGVLPFDPQNLGGFSIADYDRDGLLDIYVMRHATAPKNADQKSSWLDDRTGPGNTLLRNLSNWKFEDVTSTSGSSAGNLSCFAAVWLDANGDMWPDLFVSDEFGSPVLLVNQENGTFESRSITGGFGGFCMGLAAGDLDDDGRIDLYLANMYSKAGERVLSNLNFDLYPPDIAARMRHIVDGSELWHNRGDLEFESKGRAAGVARVGWAYGPCLADLDNDGALDIYAPAGFYSVSRTEPDG